MQSKYTNRYSRHGGIALMVVMQILSVNTALAHDSEIKFVDIANQRDSGISYRRTPSENNAILNQIKRQSIVNFGDPNVLSAAPIKPRGAPGVAVFDFDSDGDLDLYITNGPGTANSLYSNQYRESGSLTFIDVAAQTGVSAVAQDSTGVCYGDIDNDGDPDILVLSNYGFANKLFENRVNKTGLFVEASAGSALESIDKTPASCAMGDINNDGLLDIAIANTFNNWNHRLPSLSFDFDHLLQANQLFLNTGRGFKDISAAAGIDVPARITWAVSLVDYDLDGDLDFITADDQGPKPPEVFGGIDHGYVRIYQNDGSGVFEDVTATSGTNRFGAWMGLAFGDIDSDGSMDIFATNSGDYFHIFMDPLTPFPAKVGDFTTGWFLGDSEHKYRFPGVGKLRASPFGWGAAIVDYDNDTDADIIYYGGANMAAFVDASNPGVILNNDGEANFLIEATRATQTAHNRRNVQGLAVGDLNDDGFVDIVSVSSENWPEDFPLAPYLPADKLFNSPFDRTAYIWPTFVPIDMENNFAWTGLEPEDGSLSIEVSSGNKDNNWVKVLAKGSVGMIKKSVVNRDGIGAVIRFTPERGKTAMHPVLGGSSYASQNSLELTFGLGESEKGTLDILWPGGVRNRLYNVRARERVTFPEIPCSYADKSIGLKQYNRCVRHSLRKLEKQGVIIEKNHKRFIESAIRAYLNHNRRDY